MGRVEAAFCGDSADGGFVAPSILLMRVCVDSCDDGVNAASGAGGAGRVFGKVVRERVADGRRFGSVAVAFENLFGCDFGVVGPETGVVEDESEIFGDLE